MAEERTITTVFKADISNFSASTQELNRYVSQVNSEFKNATASMGKWNDNADGLRAKLEQLNKVHDAENKKLKSLEAQYADVVKTQGANSKAAQKLATDINNQSAKVKEVEKNIDHYADSLKELEDAGVDTREELEKLNKKLDDQKQAAKDLGSGIAKGAAAGIAGIGAACAGAFAGLNSIVEETKELRTQMAQLETAFVSAGLSVEASEKTFNDLYAVLGDSGKATEASMHLAQVAQSEQELEQMTHILTGVYAKFGDSLPVEGLAEAISVSSTLGEVNGSLADALEFSGYSVDSFNEQLAALATEEERAALINSTLNDIYGESATQYKEVNAEVIAANEAQNKYNQAMADIGEMAQPAITSFKTAMVGVLQTVLEKFSEVDIEGLIGKISGAITSLVEMALPPLMTALTWVLDNANWLVPVLGSIVGVIGSIAAGVKIYNGVMQIAKVVQLAWNAVLAANPIGLVIAAVAALVAGFVLLWNKCEGFRNFWIGLWEIIKSTAKAVGDWFVQTFSAIGNFFSDMWTKFGEGAKNAWQGIKNTFSKVAEFFGDIFGKAWKKVKDVFSVGGKIFDGIKDGIVTAFKTIVNGIITGINKVIAVPFKAINGVLKKIKSIEIVGIKPFNWVKTFTVPEIPKLAKGGIVDRPTLAMVGEAGKEVVMPLENNTAWIDKLAEKLGANTGNQSNTYNITNKFERMETSRHALHKANLETRRILKGGLI